MVIRSLCRALAGLALSFITAVPLNAAPSISSFTPASGTIANKVTITGSGFTGATAVKFNGVAASFIVNSGTQITATVPNAAWTGPITVTAGGLTGASATSFTVTPGMGLSFIVGHPLTSPTIFGAGFHATTGVDLYFDTQNVALFVSSPTGTLSATYQIPLSAQPGQHWITFMERNTGLAAQKAFTVQTDWAEEGFGPSGRGVNFYENTLNLSNVATLNPAWTRNAGGTGNPSPFVIAGGSAFVAAVDGYVRAYSKTGAPLWTAFPGGDMQLVNPVAALGRVFVGDKTGNVSSYSQTCRSDGGVCAPQWTTNIGAAVTAGLTFYDGTLYAPSADGSVHTLNPTTGAQGLAVYGFDTTHGAVTTPIAFDTDGSFYYGAGATLEFNTQFLGSSFATYGGLVSPIAVASGSAFFTTQDGMLHRAGPGNWDVTISTAGCASAPVVALGYVYAGGCSSLAAHSLKTGAIVWSTGTGVIWGLSEANAVLYACEGTTGTVQVYGASYGGNLWSGGYCISAPEVANGELFAALARLSAYELPPEAGAVRLPPSISSLHPDYKLKPQLSGTPVVSRTPPEVGLE